MKILVRTFVLSLAVTGAVASSHALSVSNLQPTLAPHANEMPCPMCPPNDPNGCGIGAYGH